MINLYPGASIQKRGEETLVSNEKLFTDSEISHLCWSTANIPRISSEQNLVPSVPWSHHVIWSLMAIPQHGHFRQPLQLCKMTLPHAWIGWFRNIFTGNHRFFKKIYGAFRAFRWMFPLKARWLSGETRLGGPRLCRGSTTSRTTSKSRFNLEMAKILGWNMGRFWYILHISDQISVIFIGKCVMSPMSSSVLFIYLIYLCFGLPTSMGTTIN